MAGFSSLEQRVPAVLTGLAIGPQHAALHHGSVQPTLGCHWFVNLFLARWQIEQPLADDGLSLQLKWLPAFDNSRLGPRMALGWLLKGLPLKWSIVEATS